MSKPLVIDLFCGAGGETQGIHWAMGYDIELFAVNHWEIACSTHAKNFPHHETICQDVTTVIPSDLTKGKPVELLWASPECTHHSVARGGKPMDDQSRCTPFDILRWLAMADVKRLIIENVPEYVSWGPLGADNRPIKEKRGLLFQQWISFIAGMGYDVEWKILNAADFGAPTSRRRFFLQAVKHGSGKSITWPTPSHVEHPDAFSPQGWIPARKIIDWSIPSPLIDDRKRPLAPNTMRRIMQGIERYWGDGAKPFITRYNGGDNRNHSIDDPMPVLDTSNRYGLVQPIITSIGHTSSLNRSRSIDGPLPTIVTKQEHCLVQPLFIPQQSKSGARPTDRPLSTILTSGTFYLVEPLIMEYYGNGRCLPVSRPLGTVTTKERFALLEPHQVGIGFRMLQPHELAAAQSFPADYIFTGNKGEVVRQIGNAVPPKLAEALV